MVSIEKSTKVRIHDKKYYNTMIPKRIAEDLLGLTIDKRKVKQKITWKVEKSKVIVEGLK